MSHPVSALHFPRFGAVALCGLVSSLLFLPGQAQSQVQIQSGGGICDNQKFLTDQAGFMQTGPTRVDIPEHICGQVFFVTKRPRRTHSGVHGYFVVEIAPGRTIRIVSDLDRMSAPLWPWVQRGDHVDIVGRYYFDSARSQGIDWTHHGTGRHWSVPGSVTVNGVRYE